MKPTGASASSFFVSVLAADALLQLLERRRRAVLPDEDLAVEHRAFGQALGQRHHFRKAVGHQFLAARPDPAAALAPQHLGTDAVVLPFDQPAAQIAQPLRQRRGILGPGVRQEEGVRLTRVGLGLRRMQRVEACGRGQRLGVGVAHQPLRHHLGIDIEGLGQCALHQQLADADTKATADQLGQQEAARCVELAPPCGQRVGLRVARLAAQRQQPLLEPLRQAQVARVVGRGQHMGDGFGQVAHGLVALLEQPVGQAGLAAGGGAQQRRRHRLARLAAGQEVHRPGGIGGVGSLEVLAQRRHLVERGGAGVECGVQRRETLHLTRSGARYSVESTAVSASLSTSGTGVCLTISTGTWAACSTSCDTEPSIALRSMPMPRAPITTMSQPKFSRMSISVCAGSPEATSISCSTPAARTNAGPAPAGAARPWR